MKTIIATVLLTSGLSAFAQTGTNTASPGTTAGTTTGTTTTTTTTTTASAVTANDTPTAACKSMVENAKNKNYEAFMKMTTDMPMHAKKNPKATKNNYNKMHSQYIDRLQDLTCGNEIIAQDHAVVESESKNEKRLVPFIKTNDGWKFDMKTYQSFYHTTDNAPGKRRM